jgi:hypothetical protein
MGTGQGSRRRQDLGLWECDLLHSRCDPALGKDAWHLFILTGVGVVEGTADGENLSASAAVSKELTGESPLTWMDLIRSTPSI